MQKKISFFFLSIFLINTLACSLENKKMFKKTKFLMDTVVTITVISNSEQEANIAIDKAFLEIEKIEKLTNIFSKNSEINNLNRYAGLKRLKVSDTLYNIIELSLNISQMTQGAFDITIGSITSLYDYYKKIKPDEDTIKKRLKLVNYKDIILDKNNKTVFLKNKGMTIDLGGIAKGYAADKAVESLKENNIKSGLVAIAGDIKSFGLKPNNKPWKIGIRDPRSKNKEDLLTAIDLTDMSISTSGNYERFFISEGKRYHHIISPFTGLPASECQSVTIIAKDCYLTDSLATGIFVIGPKNGLKLLEDMGYEGIIIDKDGKLFITQGLKKKLEL